MAATWFIFSSPSLLVCSKPATNFKNVPTKALTLVCWGRGRSFLKWLEAEQLGVSAALNQYTHGYTFVTCRNTVKNNQYCSTSSYLAHKKSIINQYVYLIRCCENGVCPRHDRRAFSRRPGQ
ncbi:hypothetical protein PF005_g3712 [Phytophthora fragariae]|uniref:Secreted protein n=1 Tax=Phytophthora fragariae TaxID=53985 RepID=A0A6A3LXX9_9STRA|nr:hypothetical protein PF003_g21335 [Phytophthora fragariae]KAE8946379.1 hypothetical protein PF009_g3990 [Phytophthora fragariae]KAE9024319.1 hypothetical protein PF011_g3563 [Phytophthora fragariae]KAE9130548.1 hypothetical protein PF010_g3811 [Phytophthora fragariae]KAE9134347.1 hypothetical protein PF007_g2975 [Phytophthora fragariae]